MSLLPDAERVVLIARYGLAGGPPCTLGLAADALGVSRERIRILEKRALESLIPRSNIVAPGSEPILLAAN